MSAATEAISLPWQPLTLGGVASFGRAPLKRLLAVELAVAVIAAVGMVFLARHAGVPPIEQAIANLPEEGSIHDGFLVWPTNAPVKLAESPFLCLVADPDGQNDFGQTADFQIELNQHQFKIRSLLGYSEVPYPRGWIIRLNRPELIPWWGAWKPFLLVGVGLATVAGLFLSWAALALLYSLPARLLAYFGDREATGFACWKLSGAALMPGALIMTIALFLYALHDLPLVALLVALGFHILIGWIYVLGGTLRLPLNPAAQAKKANPFQPPPPAPAPAPAPETPPAAAEPPPRKTEPPDPNPFHRGSPEK